MTEGVLRTPKELEAACDNVVPLTPRQAIARFAASPYETEKDLCKHVEENIRPLCRDLGYPEVIGYKRECRVSSTGRRATRVDFRVEISPGHHILIECKNPCHTGRELLASVGQILDYAVTSESDGVSVVDCWLLTTKLDLACLQVVHRFRLPISMCVLGSDELAVWRNYAGRRLV